MPCALGVRVVPPRDGGLTAERLVKLVPGPGRGFRGPVFRKQRLVLHWSMRPDELESQIAGISTLDEPVRRDLYLYVAEREAAVGRDEAAEAVGVSRALAAFHLDKLVEAGLLEVEFRRLTGRSGPGAGLPAKLYRRSARQL